MKQDYSEVLGRDLFGDDSGAKQLEKQIVLKNKRKELKAAKKAEQEQQAIVNFTNQVKTTPQQLTKIYMIRNINDGTYLYHFGGKIVFKKHKKQGKSGGGTVWKTEDEVRKFLASLLERQNSSGQSWKFFFDGATAKDGGKTIIQNCEIVEHQILETRIAIGSDLLHDLKSKQLAAQREALEKEQAKLQKEIEALNKELEK